MIDKTRKILVELYIGCEEDFINGLQIFEQIVENQIKQTSDIQISNLKKSLKETLEETDLSPNPETSQSFSASNKDPDIYSNPNPNPESTSLIQPQPVQTDNTASDQDPEPSQSPGQTIPSTNPSLQSTIQSSNLPRQINSSPSTDLINPPSGPPILRNQIIGDNESQSIDPLNNNVTLQINEPVSPDQLANSLPQRSQAPTPPTGVSPISGISLPSNQPSQQHPIHMTASSSSSSLPAQ